MANAAAYLPPAQFADGQSKFIVIEQVFGMASKPINIRRIETGSEPFGKIARTILELMLHFFLFYCPRKAVYNTM